MIVPVYVAAFGSRSTISGLAAISPSPKSSRFAHHRVHRRLDYPASLGLDQTPSRRISFKSLMRSSGRVEQPETAKATCDKGDLAIIAPPTARTPLTGRRTRLAGLASYSVRNMTISCLRDTW